MSAPLYEIPRGSEAERIVLDPGLGELRSPILDDLVQAVVLEVQGEADLRGEYPDRGEVRGLKAIELRRHAGAILELAQQAA